MIFSSAHTDTQDRMVSSTTSITHFCPSWHNIVDIQVKCLSLSLWDRAFTALLLLLQKSSLDH